MVLHRFEYTAEMCDCRYCPYYRGKRKFSILKDRFANLDELNYLAKRMESFDYHEYDQFLIGITKLQNPTEKDLINLTFNLDHFTLCKDVSSYGKIGREYVMNTQGAVPAHDEDDPKYAAIGKDLIDRGLAQITAKGLLIYNPFDELTEVYDGQAFPEYFYENTLASAEVSYNGRTELLLLPGEEIAIQKALARLGAPSDSDCEIKFCLNQGEDDAWEERIEGIIRSEGLYETNKMLRSLDTDDMDWGKLTAAVELADVKSAANIAAVAQHLGEFGFLPDAKSESDVGHFLVNNVDEYGMNIEMEEYFDFSGFGEYFAEEHDGQFVNGGFVYGTQSILFAGRADERYQIVVASELRDQLDILAQGLRSVLGKPMDNNAEHPALTKATANIASEEQDLHGNIRVLRICADKASDDFLIVGCTERADACEQIQTVRHCACVGNCAVFCVGNIRLTLQMIQHFNSSSHTAQKNFITQTP